MATKELVSTPFGYGEIEVLPTATTEKVQPSEEVVPQEQTLSPPEEPVIHKVAFKWGGIGYLPV